MRGLHKLNAALVRAEAGKKRLSDGGGLVLSKNKGGNASWIFRYKLPQFKYDKEMGLGGYPDVSLAKARELAAE